MTTPSTGYTYDPTPMQQARNMAAHLTKLVGRERCAEICGDLLIKHFDVSPEFLRELASTVNMALFISKAFDAAIDEPRNEKYPASPFCPHDPRTPEQRDLDEWEADTRRTMEDARPF